MGNSLSYLIFSCCYEMNKTYAVAEQLETDKVNVFWHIVIVSITKHYIIVKNPMPDRSIFFFEQQRS